MLGVLAGAVTGIATFMGAMLLFGRDLLDAFHDYADEVNDRAVWILLTIALLTIGGMWAGWTVMTGEPYPVGYAR
jgi:hypothetical protein